MKDDDILQEAWEM